LNYRNSKIIKLLNTSCLLDLGNASPIRIAVQKVSWGVGNKNMEEAKQIKAVVFDVGGVLYGRSVGGEFQKRNGEGSINRGVVYLIQKLKLCGYRIGILSNTISKSREGLKRMLKEDNVLELFEVIVTSDDAGIKKPDVRIFNLLRGKLFLKPQDILFIDDEQRQIDGAEKLGIKTMLFQDATQLEADLVVIGVLHKQE